MAELRFLLHARVLSDSALRPDRPSAVAKAPRDEHEQPRVSQGQEQQADHKDAG